VYYTTLEKFSNDYVNAVQNNKITIFKEKYRKYDALIMDDVQFVSGKEKTQEELFHVFNTLYDNNKQIIFSSDKHPNFIPGLEDRLRSRFSAGMIVDIGQPDYESRVAILKAKLGEQEFSVSNEGVLHMAQVIQGNIRELEGVLNAVVCQTKLKARTLSLQEIKTLIKANVRPRKNISINDVVKVIANYYNLDEENLYEKTRRKEIVKTRQVAMYLLREDYNISYPLIGKKLGGKDHTTVIHSYTKIKQEAENDSLLTQEIDQIRAMLNT
jgi:chromosomal replication initiator protein